MQEGEKLQRMEHKNQKFQKEIIITHIISCKNQLWPTSHAEVCIEMNTKTFLKCDI